MSEGPAARRDVDPRDVDALIHHVGRVVRDARVLEALRAVPRERFVPSELRAYAHEDVSLPIGYEQTISQPTVVGMMLEAMALSGTERVLEVGTGSGYQAALLSRLAAEVVTVEIVAALRERAAAVLAELGARNVRVLAAGDGLGAPEHAPYDAIVVAAAAPRPPPSLIAQLRVGGRLVLPVGELQQQQLVVLTRHEGGWHERSLGACRFVPLLGPEGLLPAPPPM